MKLTILHKILTLYGYMKKTDRSNYFKPCGIDKKISFKSFGERKFLPIIEFKLYKVFTKKKSTDNLTNTVKYINEIYYIEALLRIVFLKK